MKRVGLFGVLWLLVMCLVGCAPQGSRAATEPTGSSAPAGFAQPAVYAPEAVVSQTDALLFYRPVTALAADRSSQETITLDLETPGILQVCAVDAQQNVIYTLEPAAEPGAQAGADAAVIGIYDHAARACHEIGRAQTSALRCLYADAQYVVWCEATRSGVDLVDPTLHLYDRVRQTDRTWTLPAATLEPAMQETSFPPLSTLVVGDHVYMEVVTGMAAETGVRTAVYKYGIGAGALERCAADAAKPYRLADGTAGWCALAYDGDRVTEIRRVRGDGTASGAVDASVVLSRASLTADAVVASDFLQSWRILSEGTQGLAPEAVDASGIRLFTGGQELPLVSGRHTVYVEAPSCNGRIAAFRFTGAELQPLFYDLDAGQWLRLDGYPAAEYIPFVTDGQVVFVDGAHTTTSAGGRTSHSIRLIWVDWP